MTGRLIDADVVYKILESCEIKKATIGNPLTDWEYGYNCGIERAESEIECAPTVEAIPVEWMKQKYPAAVNHDSVRYISKVDLLNEIIEEWRKEE